MSNDDTLTAEQIAGILAFAPADADLTTTVAFERTRPAPVRTAAEIEWQHAADAEALARHQRGGRRARRAR